MAKIMLVEDDNNLREIYAARLQAEGHEIVAAKDGEEALAIAVKEKPDLIISDVMMPRVSGFDMLDILRNAPETRETKVIMMTALSQAEDKARADKLGADRYLVKSQVTLEDVANVVREVLAGEGAAGAPSTEASTPETQPATPEDTPATTEVSSATETTSTETPPSAVPPTVQDVPVATPPADDATTDTPAEPAAPTANDVSVPVVTPPSEDTTQPAADTPIETPSEPAAAPAIPSPSAEPTPIAPPPNAITPETPSAEPPKEATKINIVEAPKEEDVTPPAETPVAAPEAPSAPAVVLPTPPDEVVEAPKEDTTTETPATPAEPAAAPVGPSLAEALAEEESTATSSPESTPEASATPVVPEIANGTENQVITPTQEPEAPKEEEPDVVAGPPERTSIDPLDDERTQKKVIEPLNDITKGPDLQALLAAEEKKAPVEAPGASSVITPSDAPATPEAATTETPKADQSDQHSKIAL